MMWWNGVGYGMGWGGWVLMAVVMVAFWGLVVAGVLALFHSMRMDRTAPFDPDGRAREILDERFARGEIDAEEYRLRRNELRARQ
ncbi:SHOCT domain-containing protein (plasmid) [Rhodococcus opacus]|uniref:SHOCT domain-containing protein n=1 Tax=Rhodococcus opacus TaxID=37919 RepID=A0AAX3YTA6_RHOOP|nr:SHOCT domain-containing protein [Rhodococcus opacus]RYF60081.1 MAG: SHOCT domain-containing protein [Comamonadaceae bacterium]MCZ4586082.1 SHOCT domain-containing protein [Rhodococcus opacus]MDV6245387.1 SHOCT domain-containing protein [Rhodococcus opacus]WKN60418.1 SHOCT domain-containing protein [Rhodococcus opacus]WLF51978.1 SHOCT domain-containing protein [Rhodococcus opacus]